MTMTTYGLIINQYSPIDIPEPIPLMQFYYNPLKSNLFKC